MMVEEMCGGGLTRWEVKPAGAGIAGVVLGSECAVAMVEEDDRAQWSQI